MTRWETTQKRELSPRPINMKRTEYITLTQQSTSLQSAEMREKEGL